MLRLCMKALTRLMIAVIAVAVTSESAHAVINCSSCTAQTAGQRCRYTVGEYDPQHGKYADVYYGHCPRPDPPAPPAEKPKTDDKGGKDAKQ